MVLRSVAFDTIEKREIDITEIFDLVDGQYIHIPGKIEEVRGKGRAGNLICPCGCNTRYILVAGDRGLRAPHFRLKESSGSQEVDCLYKTEEFSSIHSKFLLKKWLKDVLGVESILHNVPVNQIGTTSRRFEISLYEPVSQVGLCYWYNRANIDSVKINTVQSQSAVHHVVYVVDSASNITDSADSVQYPEFLKKLQDVQGYVLFFSADKENDYAKTEFTVSVFVKNYKGFWGRLDVLTGNLADFSVSASRGLYYQGKSVADIAFSTEMEFLKKQERLLEEFRRMGERRKKALLTKEKDAAIRKLSLKKKQGPDDSLNSSYDDSLDEYTKELQEIKNTRIHQQETIVVDSRGNRWLKCRFCGKISTEKDFSSYGGAGSLNLGTCYDPECSKKSAELSGKKTFKKNFSTPRAPVCPDCGKELVERKGRNGKFWGCKGYPACKYTENIRQR